MSSTPPPSLLHVVVMGTAGTGKSTVAQRLAAELGLVLAEGDDFHPADNITKMSAGIPLDDADREPWLRSLAVWTAQQHAAGRATVVTCSALRETYRDVLRTGVPDGPTRFVHLEAPREVLVARMTGRDHFMPASLLDSQLDTLEPLAAHEDGIVVDVSAPVDEVVARALAWLRRG
ncbi:gluconokinase [Nocardioides sp.]|uniref:gluconokinase n=1 Tax=Nocardioides sp. TaxID=35761 RepID=UPI00273525ED|nr:gluconokinase [Nocardioides sp.]MDP3892840.1 gluconokinase [Nocardioides sp.]